jgi:hypothetical protein
MKDRRRFVARGHQLARQMRSGAADVVGILFVMVLGAVLGVAIGGLVLFFGVSS